MIKLIIIQLLFIPFIATGESIHDGSSEKISGDTVAFISRCEDFEVSGDGCAESWSNTAWINIPQRIDKPDLYTTRAKVLYSGTGIYFLFECEF